jgi:hypothetical protein
MKDSAELVAFQFVWAINRQDVEGLAGLTAAEPESRFFHCAPPPAPSETVIDCCISNALVAAPEAQCSIAPRFSVGEADSTRELRSPVGTVQDISLAGLKSPPTD